jgi:predicted membrane-bound spermidine synthase
MLPFVVFFLSGAAALLYQVVWQRLLVIYSGADVYSVTVIVAAFMGGLGIGSLAGGYFADRVGSRRSLYAFGAAELLIGLFGMISKFFYYDTLYEQYSQLIISPITTALVLSLTLLVPTFLMGLSLPLLARALADSLGISPRVIGMLYGLNTLGAAAGAFSAPWVLIPRFGLEGSLWIAAALNLTCAVLAVGLAQHAGQRDKPTSVAAVDAVPETHAPEAVSLPFGAWVALYALTGFIALSLEIVWFRLLGVLLKSTTFTFGTLLGVYLCGLGAGAAFGARLVTRSRRPGATFLAIQYGVTLYAAVSIAALVALIAAGHPIKLVRFLGTYDPVDVYDTVRRLTEVSSSNLDALTPVADFAVLYLVVPAVLIGPPTFLMGFSFPFLQKASQIDFARLGRRLGTLLGSNIAGAVLGATAAGWLLLPVLGTAGTLRVLVALGVLLAWPLSRLTWPTVPAKQRRAIGAAAVVTGLCVLAMPGAEALWARLHGTTPQQILFDEDGAGLSVFKIDPASPSGAAEVYVNGLGQSWLPYGNIHTALGALPVFIHESPAEVALIGLGSGDTAFAAAGRAEVQRLTSIEILGAQRRTLERYAERWRYPGLSAVLSDPRIEHRVDDGRAYINRSNRRFDIIEADALRPSSTFAGNLYSREYFELMRRRLEPGGFGVTWAPTGRIRSTFLSVFPHVLAFPGDILIGSERAIPFDRDEVLARAAAAHPYYVAAGVDIDALLRLHLEGDPQRFGPGDRRATEELNTDLFPRDEFALPF